MYRQRIIDLAHMPGPTKKQRNPVVMATVVSVVVATFFGFMAGFIAGQPGFTRTLMSVLSSQEQVSQEDSALGEILDVAGEALAPSGEEERRIAVVERAMPAVVSVVVDKDVPVFEQYYRDPFEGDDFFGQFFAPDFGVPQPISMSCWTRKPTTPSSPATVRSTGQRCSGATRRTIWPC
jgi:hypothetical protein